MKPLEFISLRSPAMNTPGRVQCERVSSLAIGGAWTNPEREHVIDPSVRASDLLNVTGGLDHGTCFIPATREDRDRLVKHLRGIKYPRPRYYVGYVASTETAKGARVLFRSSQTPTRDSHGNAYAATIGPFRTRRGAVFMRDYGENNPHCQTVSDAERLARELAK